MSSVYIIIYYIIFGIWIFPPIRQYNTKYFYFFLVLLIGEITTFIFYYSLKINTILIYSIVGYILLLSLLSRGTIKKYIVYIIILLLLISLIDFSLKNSSHILLISFQILVSLILIKNLIIEFRDKKEINLFSIILIFYVLTLISKFLNLFAGMTDAYTYFLITSPFEILLGLFFSIFKANNSQLILQLK